VFMICNSDSLSFRHSKCLCHLRWPDPTCVGARWSSMERKHEPDLNDCDANNRHASRQRRHQSHSRCRTPNKASRFETLPDGMVAGGRESLGGHLSTSIEGTSRCACTCPPSAPPLHYPLPAGFSPDGVRPGLLSKVDKYFEASYGTLIYMPRCEVAPSMATVLLENAKFGSWDAIFQLIERPSANKANLKWLEQFSIF
jgi:hypothetical protein